MADEQSQAESMPDAAEAAALEAELRGQETPPVEMPVETAPTTEKLAEVTQAPEVSQAIDYAALEATIAKMGDGYTLQDSPGIIKNLLSGMNDAQRQRTEIKQRYQPYDGLIEGLKDPGLSSALEEAAKDYYAGADGVQQPPEVAQALDPLMNRVNQMEVELANQKMREDIGKLRSDGYEVSAEDETAIWNKVVETGSRNVQDHYWAVKGPQLVTQAAKNAQQKTVEGIQKANSAYVPPPAGPAAETKSFDSLTATPEETEAEMIDDLRKMMG